MIVIVIIVIVAFVIYSKWSDHLEEGIKRMEGQIKRAKDQDTPPDQK